MTQWNSFTSAVPRRINMPRSITTPMIPKFNTRRCCNRLNFKIGKDKEEDEEIIDAEGFFDDIAGKKLQRFLFPESEIDGDIHQKRKHNPKNAPDNRLSNGHRLLLCFVKHIMN